LANPRYPNLLVKTELGTSYASFSVNGACKCRMLYGVSQSGLWSSCRAEPTSPIFKDPSAPGMAFAGVCKNSCHVFVVQV